jgi:hypothetical protein
VEEETNLPTTANPTVTGVTTARMYLEEGMDLQEDLQTNQEIILIKIQLLTSRAYDPFNRNRFILILSLSRR